MPGLISLESVSCFSAPNCSASRVEGGFQVGSMSPQVSGLAKTDSHSSSRRHFVFVSISGHEYCVAQPIETTRHEPCGCQSRGCFPADAGNVVRQARGGRWQRDYGGPRKLACCANSRPKAHRRCNRSTSATSCFHRPERGGLGGLPRPVHPADFESGANDAS